MKTLQENIEYYLEYCKKQKCLEEKTLKAYRIDLGQFCEQVTIQNVAEVTSGVLENYIARLHQQYKPKTVKRKIASIKALFHYLDSKEIIDLNPFNKLQIKFQEPETLPKTIPLHTIETFLSTIYNQCENAKTSYQKRNALRDAAVAELLFAIGMRISELCSLKNSDVNLHDGTILIHGKGDKTRCIQIDSQEVIHTLEKYKNCFYREIQACGYFFVNQPGKPLSDQVVRRMINKYASLASIDLHITPQMFRHTFATSLLEADADIRFIQEILGHNSISSTEVYTQVAVTKQKNILTVKYPRKDFHIYN